MADPLTLGTMGVAAAGGIVQGIGARFSGEAQGAAYRYKAGVALLNKQINEQNANWALESGDIRSMEEGLKAREEIGQVNTGSAAAVRDTQTKVAQFDQNVISWDASKTAWGFESKAATDLAESRLDITAADTAEKAGTLAEIGSFIGGASSVAGKWYQGKAIGMIK